MKPFVLLDVFIKQARGVLLCVCIVLVSACVCFLGFSRTPREPRGFCFEYLPGMLSFLFYLFVVPSAVL